jgi:hypothetical protein
MKMFVNDGNTPRNLCCGRVHLVGTKRTDTLACEAPAPYAEVKWSRGYLLKRTGFALCRLHWKRKR